jgi:hypothetical protein
MFRERITTLYITAFVQMRRMRKPSVLIVFLFLVAAAHSEIPENIRLGDDISNDFVVSAHGIQPAESHAVSEGVAPTSGTEPVEVVPARTIQNFWFPAAGEPFHQSGQDRLLLCSIQRI